MKYFEKRRKARLYRQWTEQAGLPPEEAISFETRKPRDTRSQTAGSEAIGLAPENPPAFHVGLDNQMATHPDASGGMLVEIKKRQTRLPLLYMLLGISIVIFFVVLVLFIVWAC